MQIQVVRCCKFLRIEHVRLDFFGFILFFKCCAVIIFIFTRTQKSEVINFEADGLEIKNFLPIMEINKREFGRIFDDNDLSNSLLHNIMQINTSKGHLGLIR